MAPDRQARSLVPVSNESAASIAEQLLARVPSSPDVFLQNIDLVRQAALLIQLDEPGYRSASFLDDRMLTPTMKGAWVPLGRIAAAAGLISGGVPLHFIFHTGHVGSTLASRLLDETAEVLGVREPLPLRVVAEAYDVLGRPESLLSEADFDATLETLLRLWSRRYATTRAVVIKATSSAGRIAPALLVRSERSRAIYMNVRAEPYLATLLAGANSPIDLRGHGAERMRRLRKLGVASLPPLHALSIGELAAMSWLAETATQRDAMLRLANRVIAVDFDQMLSSIEPTLARILGHFDLPHDAARVATLARSAVMTRYSKAPQYEYSPGVRAEVLRDSYRDNREQIGKGMAWLEARARSDAALAQIVNATAF